MQVMWYTSTRECATWSDDRIFNAFSCGSRCYLIPNIIIESLRLLEKATASLPNPVNKIKGFPCKATILFWQSPDPINLLTIAGCSSM